MNGAGIRLSKSLFVQPPTNGPYVVVAVAVSLFTFAYSVNFGQILILLLYALWFLPVAVQPRILMHRVGSMLPFLALAALATISTLWSENPSASLRTGIQYTSTIVCAVIAARIAGPRSLVVGGLVGSILVLAYSVANGRYSYDVVDGSYQFVGAFASKNQLGFFASLAMLFALFSFFVEGRLRFPLRVVGLLVGAFGTWTLMRTGSATSVITIAGTLGGAVALLVGGRMRALPRFVIFAAGAVAVLLGAVVALQGGAFEGILGAFGKDTTLTGRTYLWREGLIAFQKNPIVGMGYSAFWTVGFEDAERLWEEFFIAGKTGFHFHNAYIEVAVGLGTVGLVVCVMTLVAFLALAVRALLRPMVTPDTVLSVSAGILLLMRSMVEIDFLTPYTVGSFLLYFAVMRLLLPVPEANRRTRSRPSRHRIPIRAPWSGEAPRPST